MEIQITEKIKLIAEMENAVSPEEIMGLNEIIKKICSVTGIVGKRKYAKKTEGNSEIDKLREYKETHTLKETAEHFGMNIHTVTNKIYAQGHYANATKKRVTMTPDLISKVKQLTRKGKSVDEVAEKLGISKISVIRHQ